jgi:DNA-binding NarL/FixJ family response regulator
MIAMQNPPKVVLADDHVLLLDAFRRLLESRCEIVGQARDGRVLLDIVEETRPDLVVLDISMPGLNGIDAGEHLRRLHPNIRLLYLTVNEDANLAAEVIRRGAAGFLLKNSAATELFEAIKQIMAGRVYVTPLLTKGQPLNVFLHDHQRGSECTLTPRQREVLQLLAEGLAMKEVAARLDITSRTVAFHKYSIMEAIGVKTNAELLRYAVERYVVEKPQTDFSDSR